jgi:hypothetical protein
MNKKMLKMLTILTASLWVAGIGFTLAGDDKDNDKDSRSGGPPLARRIAALESVVARQTDQINLLKKALDREIAARKAADSILGSRIDNIQQSTFSPDQISTLQGIASVATVEHTNIYVGGNVCVGGDVAVRHGHTLFVSHIQPSDGDCGGNAVGVTIFDGNVGIKATNTLFVNNLRAFQAIPPSLAEAQQMGVGLGFGVLLLDPSKDNIIVSGPLLFRTLRY